MKFMKYVIPGRFTGATFAIGWYLVSLTGAIIGANSAYAGEASPRGQMQTVLSQLDAELQSAFIGETLLPRAAEQFLSNVALTAGDIVTSGVLWSTTASYRFFATNGQAIPQELVSAVFQTASLVPVIAAAAVVFRPFWKRRLRRRA